MQVAWSEAELQSGSARCRAALFAEGRAAGVLESIRWLITAHSSAALNERRKPPPVPEAPLQPTPNHPCACPRYQGLH